MPRSKKNFNAQLSVLVEMDMWYALEAYAKLKQLDGKSVIVRGALADWMRAVLAAMAPEELQLYEQILANIKSPAII